MRNYLFEGTDLRMQIKAFVIDFVKNVPVCASNAEGITQAVIFRECGLDWGDYPNAESRRQQYWLIAILRELENEGLIHRDMATKKWRAK